MSTKRRKRTKKYTTKLRTSAEEYCLFCASEELETEGSQAHSVFSSILSPAVEQDICHLSSQGGRCLDGGLRNVFILRSILHLPEEKCYEYLRLNDGELNPNAWFSLCSTCQNIVENCFRKQQRICQLDKQLEAMKLSLKKLVFQTRNRENTKKQSSNLICFDIRRGLLKDKGLKITEELSDDKPLLFFPSNLIKSEEASPFSAFENVSEPECEFSGEMEDDIEHDTLEKETMPATTSPTATNDNLGMRIKSLELESSPKDKESSMARVQKRNRTKTKKDTVGNKRKRPSLLYKCKMCPAVTKNIQFHKELHENGKGAVCSKCGLVCEKGRLPEHMKIRHKINKKEIPYYCDHCHMIFTQEAMLNRHFTSNHLDKVTLACNFCESSFISQQLLCLHSEAEHAHQVPKTEPLNDIPQTCLHCSETFYSKIKMDYHIAKNHMDVLLTCKYCNFKASKYTVLMKHIRVHTNEKPVICELCCKSYRGDVGLLFHMRQEHFKELGTEEIVCDECGIHFAGKLYLDNHMKTVHEKIKEKTCEHCGKSFAKEYELRRHILLHTAPRELQYKKGPFTCEFCEAQFNVRQGLYYHMKRLHNDKYTHRCEGCGKGYCFKNTLFVHKKSCKKKVNPLLSEESEQTPNSNLTQC